jgi:hypothetical protein
MTEYPLGERSNRRVIFMRKSEKLFCHYLFKEYNTILLSFPKKNAEEDTDGNAGETMIEPLFIMRWNVGIHGN